jgi:hypothetical protein
MDERTVQLEIGSGEVLEGQVIDATPSGPIAGQLVADLCRALGYKPRQVSQIIVDVDRVTVRGLILRDGKPYVELDERSEPTGNVARFEAVRGIDWSTGRDG